MEPRIYETYARLHQELVVSQGGNNIQNGRGISQEYPVFENGYKLAFKRGVLVGVFTTSLVAAGLLTWATLTFSPTGSPEKLEQKAQIAEIGK